MKKVIVLNGPPGVGKDTIADSIYHMDECVSKLSFKEPMFSIASSVLGCAGFEEFIELYSDRDKKEKPCKLLGGISPRQFMIEISETFIKPIFGDKYFGEKLSENLDDYSEDSLFVVSDGGFPHEIVPLARRSDARVYIVRLNRDGFSFKGDSRNYIRALDVYEAADGECYEIQECDIEVIGGDIEGTVGKVAAVIGKMRRAENPKGKSCCNNAILSEALPPHGCRLCENCGHIVG